MRLSCKQYFPHRFDEKGFTLIELAAAVLITLVVVGAGFTALVTTNKASRATLQAADTQENVRIAMELLSRDVRIAGFNMPPPPTTVGGCAIGGVPAPIVPGDNTPTGADTGPDRVSMVVPVTSQSGSTTPWTLAAQATSPFTTITLSGGAVTDMQTNWGLAANSVVSVNGMVSGQVLSVNAGADTITFAAPLTIGDPGSIPIGTRVFLLRCLTYQVIPPPDLNGVCTGMTAPCLVSGTPAALNCNIPTSPCVPLVDGIEDLQLEYACDGCLGGAGTDGQIDDLNTSGTFDQGDFVRNNTWVTPPLVPSTIRLVQISLVARQTGTEQGLGEGQATTAQATVRTVSDHNPNNGVFVAGDLNATPQTTYTQFRHRFLTRTVRARNLDQGA